MRSRLRVAAAAAFASGALCACTSSASTGAPAPSGSPAATSGPSQAAPGLSPSLSPSPTTANPVTATATLACSDYLGTEAPPAGYTVINGAVALPTGRALQTGHSGEAGAIRLFAKAGLLVRVGVPAELIVPAADVDRLAIAWGNPGRLTHRLVIPACMPRNGTATWLGYAGGYWVPAVRCASLLVSAGGRQEQVRIGVGTACPGQQPPPDPTER